MPVRIDNGQQVANWITPDLQGGAIGSGNNAYVDNPWLQGGYDMSSDENNFDYAPYRIGDDGQTYGPGGQTAPIDAIMPGPGSSTPSEPRDMSETFGVDTEHSLSQLLAENPGMTPIEALEHMAMYNDEWAEKWMDYVLEKQDRDAQNEYTANREDTAYQRLVNDLRKAGLNPAMMYGSSASPSSASSVGSLNVSEGATYRGVSNLNKIKKLLLASVLAQWQITHQTTQDTIDGVGLVVRLLTGVLGAL